MMCCLFENGALLLAYLVVWTFCFKRKSLKKAIVLAILPACIFLLSGLLLRHWLLVAFAVLFGIGHISITEINHQEIASLSAKSNHFCILWQALTYMFVNWETFGNNTLLKMTTASWLQCSKRGPTG